MNRQAARGYLLSRGCPSLLAYSETSIIDNDQHCVARMTRGKERSLTGCAEVVEAMKLERAVFEPNLLGFTVHTAHSAIIYHNSPLCYANTHGRPARA